MGSNGIYIAVGSETGLHSNVWKAWTQGDEFYAAGIADGGSPLKLSVHASGVCRLANVKLDHDWERDKDPRVIRRWKIPSVGEEGCALCFTLLVPTVFLPDRFRLPEYLKERQRSRITWVPPAPIMSATVVEFVRTRTHSPADLASSHVRGPVLGVLDLRSGSRIWCFARRQHLTPKEAKYWQTEVSSFLTQSATDEPVRDGESFGVINGAGQFTSPLIHEVAFGMSNFSGLSPDSPPTVH